MHSFTRYGRVLRCPPFIWNALSSTMIACGFFIFITSAPFVVSDHLQGDSADYGNWFLFVAGGFWLGSLTAGRASARLGTEKMMNLGNSLSAVGSAAMLLLFLLLPISYLAPCSCPWHCSPSDGG